MLEQLLWDFQAGGARSVHRLFKVDGIPEHDGSEDEIQSAGAQSLVTKRAVVDHARR